MSTEQNDEDYQRFIDEYFKEMDDDGEPEMREVGKRPDPRLADFFTDTLINELLSRAEFGAMTLRFKIDSDHGEGDGQVYKGVHKKNMLYFGKSGFSGDMIGCLDALSDLSDDIVDFMETDDDG